jgi:ferredoxin
VNVKVERELCIGAGNCVRLAPAVFALDEDQLVVLVGPAGEGDGAGEDALRAAEDACPAGAIYVES